MMFKKLINMVSGSKFIEAVEKKKSNYDDDDSTEIRNYRVVDGNKVEIEVEHWPTIFKKILVRIRGIDTPAIRTRNLDIKEEGLKARSFLEFMLIKTDKIIIKNIERGKDFRLIVDMELFSLITINGVITNKKINVADELIKEGLAIKYDAAKKPDWVQILKDRKNSKNDKK